MLVNGQQLHCRQPYRSTFMQEILCLHAGQSMPDSTPSLRQSSFLNEVLVGLPRPVLRL